jgi:hypothetical protein
VLIVAALAWTARLVHIGNLDALALAEKIAVPEPASAVDWPELRVRSVIPQPGQPSLILLLVEWPTQPGRAATLVMSLDQADQRSVPLLSQWCATRASISPTRCGGEHIEIRRRQSLERVRGVLVAEDAVTALSGEGLDAR